MKGETIERKEVMRNRNGWLGIGSAIAALLTVTGALAGDLTAPEPTMRSLEDI